MVWGGRVWYGGSCVVWGVVCGMGGCVWYGGGGEVVLGVVVRELTL